jgi:hypothetical protein
MDRAAALLFGPSGAVPSCAVDCAANPLKLVCVGAGFGQLPFTTYALGLICSNLSKGTPPKPCAMAISANENCLRPSTGTCIVSSIYKGKDGSPA